MQFPLRCNIDAPLNFHQNRKTRMFLETRQAGHHENVLNFIPSPSGRREMSKTKVGTFFLNTLYIHCVIHQQPPPPPTENFLKGCKPIGG